MIQSTLRLGRYNHSARILQRAWVSYYDRCAAGRIVLGYARWPVQRATRTIQAAWRRYTAARKTRTIWHEFVLLLAYRRYKEMRRHKDLPPFFHQDHAARSIQGAWRGHFIRSSMKRNQSTEWIQNHLLCPSNRSIAARKIQAAWRRFYFGRWCHSLLVAVNDSQQDSSCGEWNGTLPVHLLREMAFDLSFDDDISIVSTSSASGKVGISLDSALTDEGRKTPPMWDANKKFRLSVFLAVLVPTLLFSSARS
jgi:hypothetical protein